MPQVKIEAVQAFKANSLPKNANQFHLNCPDEVLKNFKTLLTGSSILGSKFYNPYTKKTERFPKKAEELTGRHLQMLARNESSNVTGAMITNLYERMLSDNQIAQLRALVKATNTAGIVTVHAYGGYYSKNKKFPIPQQMIVVDQAGLQWQADFRNTGGMLFYPKDPNDKHLPAGYAAWQRDSFKAIYGSDRPISPSGNSNVVHWNGIEGVLDFDLVSNAIAAEFIQAWSAVAAQSNQLKLTANETGVAFKFLKAGMGFFASGLSTNVKPDLEHARLKGILKALQGIAALPEAERQAAIGKIKRLELPFSGSIQGNLPKPLGFDDTLTQIGEIVGKLGLEWGGTPSDDAFAPRQNINNKNYVVACTNCGDPHAMTGNEGGYSSVDAAMASNASLDVLNAAYNPHMQLRTIPLSAPPIKNAAPHAEITSSISLEKAPDESSNEIIEPQLIPESSALNKATAASSQTSSTSSSSHGFFNPPQTGRHESVMPLSPHVAEVVKIFITNAAPQLGWARLLELDGSFVKLDDHYIEIGTSNTSGNKGLATPSYELDVVDSALVLLDKKNKDLAGQWQEVSGQDKTEAVYKIMTKLPKESVHAYFLVHVLQQLKGIADKSPTPLVNAMETMDIFADPGMPADASISLNPKSQQPFIKVGNVKIELTASGRDLKMESVDGKALSPADKHKAVHEISDNLMVLKEAFSAVKFFESENELPATGPGFG
ncbi:hypothetical protein Lbir_2308 [Legionella birminghamensis]|uniref:Uncharacterized protein n=1 Tax=Legionella birminghamensis TaxID=28083 RepID=A0A378IMG7_9GAMM|nr:hypothetical protein [Legionella birminghamensis]KTC68775.1 hypothetical protein Lbir_2308 [Legionella birminghamensis]STX33284.1 Uncharacterised protein [Legionella birminghamensis]